MLIHATARCGVAFTYEAHLYFVLIISANRQASVLTMGYVRSSQFQRTAMAWSRCKLHEQYSSNTLVVTENAYNFIV